jgi:hypothetical protein
MVTLDPKESYLTRRATRNSVTIRAEAMRTI